MISFPVSVWLFCNSRVLLQGLVRSAASYAFTRRVNVKNLAEPTDVDNIQICQADFDSALGEVKPAFGVQEDQLEGQF